MKRIVLAAVVMAALAVPFLFDFAGASAAPSSAATLETAPDFKLTDLNGKEVSLARLRGKVVILNFWATWCPPCRHEIPWFVELQQQYGPQGLQIVGISLDSSSPAHVAQFAEQMDINYPIAMGNQAIAARYGGVSVLPATFYIGRDGKIIRYVPGLIRKEEIEGIVTRALGARSTTPGRSAR